MYVYIQLYVHHYNVNVCRDVRRLLPCSCRLCRKSARAVCAEWTELAKTRFSRGPVHSTCKSICEMRTEYRPYKCMYTPYKCMYRISAPTCAEFTAFPWSPDHKLGGCDLDFRPSYGVAGCSDLRGPRRAGGNSVLCSRKSKF